MIQPIGGDLRLSRQAVCVSTRVVREQDVLYREIRYQQVMKGRYQGRVALICQLGRLYRFFRGVPYNDCVDVSRLGFVTGAPDRRAHVVLRHFYRRTSFFTRLILVFVVMVTCEIFNRTCSLRCMRIILQDRYRIFLCLLRVASPNSRNVNAALNNGIRPVYTTCTFGVNFSSIGKGFVAIYHFLCCGTIWEEEEANERRGWASGGGCFFFFRCRLSWDVECLYCGWGAFDLRVWVLFGCRNSVFSRAHMRDPPSSLRRRRARPRHSFRPGRHPGPSSR